MEFYLGMVAGAAGMLLLVAGLLWVARDGADPALERDGTEEDA